MELDKNIEDHNKKVELNKLESNKILEILNGKSVKEALSMLKYCSLQIEKRSIFKH